MNIGLDIGYNATKTISGDRRASFPSVVGTPDEARWGLAEADTIMLEEPTRVLIGQGAIIQSRFQQQRESRDWTETPEWYALFLASLTELTKATRANLNIVTGLPIKFYGYKEAVQERLLGQHRVKRRGRTAQMFTVTAVRVVPQPFGTLLSVALDDRGIIINSALTTEKVGVIDIGGKTTNLLTVDTLWEVPHETTSVSLGAWDAVRALRDWLSVEYPDLELRDHKISQVVQERQVRYYGQPIELGDVIDDILAPMANDVISRATQMWDKGAGLEAILISGGGALLLGEYVKRHFRHAVVVEDPVFANALGFWKFARRVAG